MVSRAEVCGVFGAGRSHRGGALRRDLVNVPARFAAPARKPMLHLPAHWPWQTGWKTLWDNVIGYPTIQPRAALTEPPAPVHPAIPGPTRGLPQQGKAGTGQRITHAPAPHSAAFQNNRVNGNTKIAHPRFQA